MSFKEIGAKELTDNPFSLIGNEWMLITAGSAEKYNTMTASWGGVGVIWGKNAAFCFIRPQRYTLEFVEQNDFYTLSFYPAEYKSALALCGKASGRDTDKAKETGLTPAFDQNAPYFEQAKLVLVCRKLYGQYLDASCFIDKKNISDWYPQKDFHKMFVGEIVKVLVKE